nr:hypothetical protein [Tanacetum cinerariifolium]
MDITIEQQVAMDEALVPHAQRLSWSQRMYHKSTCRNSRDMLHICLRVPGQSFAEPLFEEEILAFIHFLGHSAAIKTLTDEDFVYQVEHKNHKKSNEMYYPRFTKFDALLPIELTNEEIRNSNAYKEYYAVATGVAPPKPKASVRRTRSSSDTSITSLTAAASPRLTIFAKGKQTAKASKAKSLYALSEVAMTEAQQLKLVTKRSMQQTHISQASGSDADEGTGVDDEGKNGDDDEEDEGDDDEEGDGDDDDKIFFSVYKCCK